MFISAQRHLTILLSFIVSLAVTLVFSSVPSANFVNFDDGVHVYNNKHINPVSADSLKDFWLTPFVKKDRGHFSTEISPHDQLYSPVTFSAWTFIGHFSHLPPPVENHLDPFLFHLFSLVLHVSNTVLVFLILRLVIKHEISAAFGALIFGLHPAQVEPVAWISATNNLLSGFFALSAIWQYYLAANYSETDHLSEPTPLKQSRYVIASACFLVALLAKPSVAMVPFGLIVLDRLYFHQPWRTIATRLWLWVAFAVAVVFINRSMQLPSESIVDTALWTRLFIVGDALSFYGFKIIIPNPLMSHYGRTPQWLFGHWWAYFIWLVPTAVAFVLWSFYRRSKMQEVMTDSSSVVKTHRSFLTTTVCATLLFVIFVLPMTGIIPYYFHSFSVVADRYLYLAMLGPSLLFAGVLQDALLRNDHKLTNVSAPLVVIKYGLAIAYLIVLGSLSFRQTQHWQNSRSLWGHLLSVNPQSWEAYTNLGAIQLEQGNAARAVEFFQMAAGINPQHAIVQLNLGNGLAKNGKLNEAEFHMSQALTLEPSFIRAHMNLADLLLKSGQLEKALSHYQQAIGLAPHSATPHYYTAMAFVQHDKHALARPHFENALQINPNDVNVRNAFALSLTAAGELSTAVAQWRHCLKIDPSFFEAHLHLGSALALQGKMDEANAQWHNAFQLRPNDAQAHHAIAQILAREGYFEKAKGHWKIALQIQPNYIEAKRALSAAIAASKTQTPKSGE